MAKRSTIPSLEQKNITSAISQLLINIDWDGLSQDQKGEFYTRWSEDEKIGGVLKKYVNDPRSYIKDNIMRRWQLEKRGMNNIQLQLEQIIQERKKIEVIDTIECKKTKAECYLLWRLKDNMFQVVVSGQASAWRTLLVKTMEWEIESLGRLKGFNPSSDWRPLLVLFRNSGDLLGSSIHKNLVQSIAERCEINLLIVSTNNRTTNKMDQSKIENSLPLFSRGIMQKENTLFS